jgi:predicted Zn-dependent peptidase
VDYLAKYYKSKNVVVAVAGNIALADAKAKVKKYFKTIASGAVPKPLACKEIQANPKIKLSYKDTDQAHLVLGVRAYDLFDKRRWPLALLATILGGSMSSRLFIKIRDELGLGYYIRASASLSTDHGYFDVSAGVDKNRLEEAVTAVMAELRKVKKEGVTESEFKKAKDYIKGTTLLGLESSDEVASFFGLQEVVTRQILTLEEKFSMIDKVKIGDLKKVAEDIFQNSKVNLAIIGPVKDEKPFLKLLKF